MGCFAKDSLGFFSVRPVLCGLVFLERGTLNPCKDLIPGGSLGFPAGVFRLQEQAPGFQPS